MANDPKSKTTFNFRVDRWDSAGENIFEHVGGSEVEARDRAGTAYDHHGNIDDIEDVDKTLSGRFPGGPGVIGLVVTDPAAGSGRLRRHLPGAASE